MMPGCMGMAQVWQARLVRHLSLAMYQPLAEAACRPDAASVSLGIGHRMLHERAS